jgi:uncharacterized coiled-coil protein SlyX
MDARRLFSLTVVVVIAVLALPAAAGARTVEFRGVVSGSPYGASNGYMAVPVLYSKQTARNAGLRSPVGLLVVKRALAVKVPDGAKPIMPVNLRTGDRFKGNVVMKAGYHQSVYPRIGFSAVDVYFRSKEMSLAELTAAIDGLRKAMADLQGQLNSLKASSIKAFQDIYNQLADLKKAIAALQALPVPNFQAQLDALNKRLDDLIATLPDFSKFALLTDLSQYVKLSDLTTLLGGNTIITTLQSQVTTLQSQVSTLTSNLTTVCNAVKNATVALPAPLSTTVPVTINTGGVC